jgi:prepilin-type N-terminal cleavage/methylation domain-containing protein
MNIIKRPAPNNLPRQTVDPNRSGPAPFVLNNRFVLAKQMGPAPFVLNNRFVLAKQMGFTLIELLVAVSIFSVIAVVLYACFRGGVLSYRRTLEEAGTQQELRYILLTMEKDFKNAFSMGNIPFKGEDRRVSFTTIISDNEKAPFNAGYISYYLKRNDNAYILVRKTQTFQEALTLAEEELISETGLSVSGLSEREEVFAEDIADIRFSYLYIEKQQSGLTGADALDKEPLSFEWVDFWEKDSLPFAVKAEISFSDSADIRLRQIVKRIWIPSARPLTPEPFDV